jgi:Family of unknown function (DUF6941)
VEVDYLVVADAAVAAEGKHYIHGAGWDVIYVASYPAVVQQLAAAVRLRIPWSDTNQHHTIEIDIVDAEMVSVLPTPPGPVRGPFVAGRPPQLPVGEDQVAAITATFVQVNFTKAGTYAVVVRIDGLEAARAPFRVASVPALVALPPAGDSA